MQVPIYFNLSATIIKENYNFEFYFDKTDIKPPILDGGHKIVLINWLNYEHMVYKVNNDIPVNIPSYPYVLMCYAIIELTSIGLKQPLVTSQSQARRLDKLSQHVSVDTLSQHAIAQSQARKARHAIPAYNNTDKLSQHAVTQS